MATNPYYQRAFNALAGTLARARQMVNEFALIQAGFDKIGAFTGPTKYQMSCSDLTSDLEVNPEAGYFDVQADFTLVEFNATVAQPSASGPITITATLNGVPLFSVPLTIDQGEFSSLTAAVPVEFAITSLPKGARVWVQIVGPGVGAKGLISAALGTVTNLLPAP